MLIMYRQKSVVSGILAIIFACFLWGTTGTVASFAPDVSALAIGAFAMGMGGVFLVLSAMKTLRRDWQRLCSRPWLLVIGGLSVAVYPLAFYSSMRLSGVAIGTVVSLASAPFFAAILECLISKKQVSAQWVLSFLIGALGIGLLATGQSSESVAAGTRADQYTGVALGLLAGLSYALYSWAAKQMIEQGVHSKSAMASMFGLAAVLLLPSLAFTGDNLFATARNASVAIYMAVIPMFLGYLCFSYGLRYVDASKATLLTLLEPVIAMLLAVAIVGERFMATGWLGVGLILLCLLLQMVKLPFSSRDRI